MNEKTLSSVNEVYSSSKKVTIKRLSVKFPELCNFSLQLDRLVRYLGESIQDDFWKSIIRKLKRFRFEIIAAPLSQDLLHANIQELLVGLKPSIEECRVMYPTLVQPFIDLLDQLESIIEQRVCYLLDSLVSELLERKEKNIAIITLEPRLIPKIDKTLSKTPGIPKVSILNPALLREIDCFDFIFVIGPTRWFPNYVFTASRAPNIILLSFSWIKDQFKQEPVFLEPVKQRHNEIVFQSYYGDDDASITPEELLPPSLDLQAIIKNIRDDFPSDDEIDSVNAKVYLLQDGWAVLLDADETATVIVMDLESDLIKPIKRIKVGEIKLGDYILLRTGGGGDFVVPVADQIMGDNAPIAREFQKEWKTHLRQKVKNYGYDQVIKQLKKYGSPRANHMNIHNWMSDRSIKPEDKDDFLAIMRLIELENELESYWEMMRLIDRAHLRAGMQIRKMLLEQVNKADLSVLKKLGKMDFTIPGEQSVSITAFQVKQLSHDVIPVAPWKIGAPFEVDD